MHRCSRSNILFCLLAGEAAVFACRAQPVADIGFEEWNDPKGQPAGEEWRWGFSHKGEDGFTVCELSRTEFHGGRACLHLKDENAGPRWPLKSSATCSPARACGTGDCGNVKVLPMWKCCHLPIGINGPVAKPACMFHAKYAKFAKRP